jgi:NADPH:quinone reductase-like Zn-dependent oxidoreductase
MSAADTMRAVRFHDYGEPADVLAMETVPSPSPAAGRIRVVVHACGLNPADWALCRGLFPGTLPRGIGLEVSGTVDAVGDGVTDVGIGDQVLGMVDYAGCATAGVADRAILEHWASVPEGLGLEHAAALPMAVMTAFSSLQALCPNDHDTVLVHGAGTTVGFAAVQIAARRGLRVRATAGATYASPLRDAGAAVTAYGDGMVERVAALGDEPVDWVLDTAPASGALPDLVRIAGGDPRRVMTISDHTTAAELGVRSNLTEDAAPRFDVFADHARLAAGGEFTIPIARTFPLDEWRAAMDLSLSGRARGKLLLLP